MHVEIAYEFGFDAAHFFGHEPVGHPYRQLHGHSFTAEVVVAGETDAVTGFVLDFAELERAGAELRAQLDHALLNDIPGLEVPSLENIACWLWTKLKPSFPGLCRVIVRRPSCRQACTYSGPQLDLDDQR
jgi:6-pyruvoyltetrahydropterin/6-carboxytetrahydropterin synthase